MGGSRKVFEMVVIALSETATWEQKYLIKTSASTSD
jgi:hypothetical protein